MCKKLACVLFIAVLLVCSCKKDTTLKPQVTNPPPSSGNYLLFDADEAFNTGLSGFPSLYTSIYYSNIDGTNVTRITPVEPGFYSYRPSWSPDGKHVLFTRGDQLDNDRGIWVIDVDGKNLKNITKGDEADYSSFSPDGKKVVYAKSLTHVRPYNYDVYVANADGTAEQRLTTFADSNGSIANLHWATNGKIYFNGLGNNIRPGVYSIGSNGENLHYVMTSVYLLGVSPDSKQFLYDLGSGIYTCDTDGTNVKTVLTFGDNNPNMLIGASWSLDGNEIYFANADYPSNFGIFRITASGNGLKRILPGFYEYPAVF